jgi:hypothetical protein
VYSNTKYIIAQGTNTGTPSRNADAEYIIMFDMYIGFLTKEKGPEVIN